MDSDFVIAGLWSIIAVVIIVFVLVIVGTLTWLWWPSAFIFAGMVGLAFFIYRRIRKLMGDF